MTSVPGAAAGDPHRTPRGPPAPSVAPLTYCLSPRARAAPRAGSVGAGSLPCDAAARHRGGVSPTVAMAESDISDMSPGVAAGFGPRFELGLPAEPAGAPPAAVALATPPRPGAAARAPARGGRAGRSASRSPSRSASRSPLFRERTMQLGPERPREEWAVSAETGRWVRVTNGVEFHPVSGRRTRIRAKSAPLRGGRPRAAAINADGDAAARRPAWDVRGGPCASPADIMSSAEAESIARGRLHPPVPPTLPSDHGVSQLNGEFSPSESLES